MAGVLGWCVWARFVVLSLFCRLFVVFVVGLWCRPAFGSCVVSCVFRLPPAVSGSGVRCGRACWARVPAVPRPSWLGCRGVFFALFCCFFFSFRLLGVPVPRLVVPVPPSPFFRAGLLAFFFCGVCLLVSVPLFLVGRCSWLGVAGFGWVVPLCLFGGPVFGALWVGGMAAICVVGGRFGGCGMFSRGPPLPPPFFFFFFPGWCVVWLVPRHSWRRFLCATPRHSWLGFAAAVGGRSPPLLAGVRWRRWCVVCGVWCWCVGGVVAGVWCGWSLATPGGGSCVLLPATPGWVLLPVVVGGPRHSWLGSAGGVGVWCVVCGGGVLVGLWLVCGVVGPSPLLAEVPVCYSPPLLAGFRCRWWWAVPATPGWGPLAALVCGVWCVAVVCWWGCGWCVVWLVPCHSWRWFLCATPRHSWLGFAAGVGGRSPPLLAGVRWRRCCVVCGVWLRCVGGVVAGVWCGWSLATPGVGSCVLLPATPGWVSLPVVVGGPRHSWLGSAGGVGVWCVVCGGGVLVGLWLVCGVVGPLPLLAVVPVCYSPPLLAGFRCRCWWAVPATPGSGPLAAVVCGVWCWCVGGVVAGVWCGWSLATPGGGSCVLLPATPGWVSLPVVVGGPRHSWLGSAGGVGVWCVVCGAGVLVGLWLVCGVVGPSPLLAEVPVCYSPPLLAGFRCRWWWAVPATPGWGPLAALVCGVWRVAPVCWWGCGWCVVWLVPRHSWRRFLCATPRHSWLGFAAGGGWRSPPLLAGARWRRWCVVCGVWRWCVGGVVAGVWCGWSLATAGGGSCVLLPATPGWVSLPVVVGGPGKSWLGSAGGAGVWCVVCGVWPLVCVCACACSAWPGRAGRPPGRVLVRLTFSFGLFVFLLWLAPSGLGLPPSLSPLLPFLVALAPCFGFFFFFFFGPPAAWLFRLAVCCSLVVALPPPSPFVSRCSRRSY